MIARNGASFTVQKKEAKDAAHAHPKAAAMRPVGKKERRASVADSEPSRRDPGRDEDDDFKPWNDQSRPPTADPPQEDNFTLEDEGISAAVESSMFSITISSPGMEDNPIVYASPGFEAMSGYPHEDIIGQNCRVLQGPHVDAQTIKRFDEGFALKGFFSVEITNFHKDGTPFRNLLCITPMRKPTFTPGMLREPAHGGKKRASAPAALQSDMDNGVGDILKFVGVQCDLDERKKRGEPTDEHFIRRWKELISTFTSALCLTDSSQDAAPIAMINDGFTDLTGYSLPDVKSHSILSLCGPGTSSKTMKKLITSNWAAKASAQKVLMYKKDGTPFWAYTLSCPLSEGKGSFSRQTLHMIIDITSTKIKKIGKYIMGKVIGQGAFGLVRIAKNPQTDEIVAIKGVDASKFRNIREIEMIQEEMNVLSSLKHPHIIRLMEIQFVNSVFFLVMEFAPGGSLVSHIRKYSSDHCLDEAEAKRVFLQTAVAVDYCHRRRIVHRDLKPENILMDEQGNIKIADFGLAAVTAPFSKGLTDQVGTPQFTAPEIIAGKEYEGPSVDIWSLGVILYEALSGSLPFKGSTTSSLFRAICRGSFAPLPLKISAECKDLVQRMLVVDKEMRITMEEILKHPWCREGPQSNISLSMGMLSMTSPKGAMDNWRSPRASGTGELSRSVSHGSHEADSCPSSPPHSHSQRSICVPTGVLSRDPAGSPMAGDVIGLLHEEVLQRGGSRSQSPMPSFRAVSRDGSVRPEHVHDSARIVFNDAGQDDPITQAIMRGHLAAGSMAESRAHEEPTRVETSKASITAGHSRSGREVTSRIGGRPVPPRKAAVPVTSAAPRQQLYSPSTPQPPAHPQPSRARKAAAGRNNTYTMYSAAAASHEDTSAPLPPIKAGMTRAQSRKKLNVS